jgi:hypothetical protein
MVQTIPKPASIDHENAPVSITVRTLSATDAFIVDGSLDVSIFDILEISIPIRVPHIRFGANLVFGNDV